MYRGGRVEEGCVEGEGQLRGGREGEGLLWGNMK